MKPNLICVLFGIGVFSYLCLRAYYIPITHDEAGSFLEFVLLPLEDIVLGSSPSSTNHILHSLLVKLSVSLFGNHVFFIRLPVLLAYGVYFFFSFRLFQRWVTDSFFWILLGLIFLNLHPYLLEFFALSRGYGLGIACMMGSVYYAFQFLCERQLNQGLASFIWAALAVYSNFVFGIFYLAIGGTMGIYTFVHWRKTGRSEGFFSTCRIALFVSCLLALIVGFPLKSLIDSGAFYIGGEKGFVADTLGSLIRWNLYGQSYFGSYDLEVFGGLLIGGMILAFGWTLWKGKNRTGADVPNSQIDLQFLSLLWFVLIGGQCSYVWFLDGKYLVGRTALFLLSLTMLFLFAFLVQMRDLWWAKAAAIGSGMLLCVHFLLTANISKSHEWPLDAATPPMLDFVEQAARAREKPVSLGVHWLMSPSVEFYQHIASSSWREVYSGKELIPNQYDYYYVHEKHAVDLLEGYRVAKRFGDGQLWLLERE